MMVCGSSTHTDSWARVDVGPMNSREATAGRGPRQSPGLTG